MEIFKESDIEDILTIQLHKYIKILCGFALNRLYNISYGNKYLLDFGMLISENKKIVLYGAGSVGCDYYDIINKTSNIEVIKWIDKNFKSKAGNVESVESI